MGLSVDLPLECWSFQHAFGSFKLDCAYDAVIARVNFIHYGQRPCSTILAVSFHYDDVSFLRLELAHCVRQVVSFS